MQLPPINQFINQGRQASKMDANLVTENLYEIPTCTICLQELNQDLSSLGCGHIFHLSCITQHFQYRGSCPNCQKRALAKEIRLVIYPLVHNTKAGAHLRSLLASINSKSQGRQVQGLLMEIKQLSERSQKLANDVRELEKQSKKKTVQNESQKKQLESRNSEAAYMRRQIASLKQQCGKLKEEEEKLVMELITVRANLDILNSQKKQFEQYKVLQKVANQNSEQLIKFKKEMENSQTPAEEMTKAFFELLQVKTLNYLNMKEKQKSALELARSTKQQMEKVKSQVRALKGELEESEGQKMKWRKKYEEMRTKYRDFYQKTKSRSQQISQLPELEDSMSLGASVAARLLPPKVVCEPPERQFKMVEKPKLQSQLSFGHTGLKMKVQDRSKPNMRNLMG